MSIFSWKEFHRRIQNLALKQREPEETRLVCIPENWIATKGTEERRLTRLGKLSTQHPVILVG